MISNEIMGNKTFCVFFKSFNWSKKSEYNSRMSLRNFQKSNPFSNSRNTWNSQLSLPKTAQNPENSSVGTNPRKIVTTKSDVFILKHFANQTPMFDAVNVM